MAGYTRQSAGDIVPNNTVKSGPVNNEFNAVEDAFNDTTGHRHDGTTGGGAYITSIKDVYTDTTVLTNPLFGTGAPNNRLGGVGMYFPDGASGSNLELVFGSGGVYPNATLYDLGSDAYRFRNIYNYGTIDASTVQPAFIQFKQGDASYGMYSSIPMRGYKITGLGNPTDPQDAVTKSYMESVTDTLASAQTSASNAAASAQAAADTYDTFDDRYLGIKATAPTVDNDGDPLVAGALYFNSSSNKTFFWSGTAWIEAGSPVNGTAERANYIATEGQTTFASTYDPGFVDVYYNGLKLRAVDDFTADDGDNIVLTQGATAGDEIDIIAYGAFTIADTYTQVQSDSRFLNYANNLSDLENATTARTNLGINATSAEIDRLSVATEGQSEASKVVTASSTGAVTINSTLFVNRIDMGNAFYGDLDDLSSSSGVLDIDVALANTFAITLSEDITAVNLTNTISGRSSAFILYIKQDVGGSGYTIDWTGGTTIYWANSAGAPTLSTQANAEDSIVFQYQGGFWYGHPLSTRYST